MRSAHALIQNNFYPEFSFDDIYFPLARLHFPGITRNMLATNANFKFYKKVIQLNYASFTFQRRREKLAQIVPSGIRVDDVQ